ncbi:MAG: divalent-cation tolerance protein CutA, partial [Hyphomicrobium sp.]|nr:divalent-cation tolerance protein CutA [Hyphomicrobium sp.]
MIYATFPDRASALAMGRKLVEARLAGCVNVLPSMTSVYVWNGILQTADEAVLIAKLPAVGQHRAIAFIKDHHAYTTPAILVVPVVGGDADYIDWV